MKRTRLNPVRSTLRRGEPSAAEKKELREFAFHRAGGVCQLQLVQECAGYAPLEGSEFVRGQLVHKLSKRRFGWRESEDTGQKHYWGCIWCHTFSHNPKPCPKKSPPPS
jgi:hypothetical protein